MTHEYRGRVPLGAGGSTVAGPLPEARRREVFLALFGDDGARLPRSRRAAAERFGLTEGEVEMIDWEGVDSGWPPVG